MVYIFNLKTGKKLFANTYEKRSDSYFATRESKEGKKGEIEIPLQSVDFVEAWEEKD